VLAGRLLGSVLEALVSVVMPETGTGKVEMTLQVQTSMAVSLLKGMAGSLRGPAYATEG
jgi:CheY-specific phosphatase CheX